MNNNFNDNALRLDLIETLCSYQPLDTRDGRDVWLSNLPATAKRLLVRRNDHCKTDITFIIDAFSPQNLITGESLLEVLLKPLIKETKGLEISEKLKMLQQKIILSEDNPEELDSPPEFEEIVIGKDEKLSINFLSYGLEAGKAVAKLLVKRTIGGHGFGTGWLITPDSIITNFHVIEARKSGEPKPSTKEFEEQANNTRFWFGYDELNVFHEYKSLGLIAVNEILDYAILRVENASSEGIPLSNWGMLKVVSLQPDLFIGDRLNVIQHPKGRIKEVALRTNFYLGTNSGKNRLHYLSDTESGSSGSPVMNDEWQVIGLHRAWNYYENFYKGRILTHKSLGLQYSSPNKLSDDVVARLNEGIPIHSIIRDLPTHYVNEVLEAQSIKTSKDT